MTLKKILNRMTVLAFAAFCGLCMHAENARALSYSIAVDAGQKTGPWNRFYEQLISTDHLVTMLHSSYGRNMQNALKRGVDECGFKYFRGHGILNSDIALYSEPNGVPTYNWTKFDSVYDAAVNVIHIRPIVEFSFMPTVLASGTGTCLWYNGAPGNVTIPKDFTKWRDLCKTIVQHCEERYGVDEVRQWFFEVFNEPDLGTFFSGGQQGYFKLYDYASDGVKLADSLCTVGGPATSAGNPSWIDAFLKHIRLDVNASSGQTGAKCDFLSYHRYADDPSSPGSPSGVLNAAAQNEYNKKVVDYCTSNQFKGLIINDEWGACATPTRERDNESSASFVVKTIHLLGSNTTAYPPPFMYGYWCISDIYEEANAWLYGIRNAYDEGNYGLTLRGDATIPDSWDVAKPVFNAFKILHKMGDQQLSCTGGSAAGANGFATIKNDTSAIQVAIYDHDDYDNVTLSVSNLPFPGPTIKVEHFIVDSAHSNSYRVWVGMGKPKVPNSTQWAQLKAASDLAHLDSVQTIQLAADKSFSKIFATRKYSVSLIIISDPAKNAIIERDIPRTMSARGIRAFMRSNFLTVTIPTSGFYNVSLLGLNGAVLYKAKIKGNATSVINMPNVKQGTYMLSCGNGKNVSTTKLVVCK